MASPATLKHTRSEPAWPNNRSPPVNIGPCPVQPPEPYLPLRKASPHRLQGRKGGHHPLLYTGPRGAESFRPGTSPPSAPPDFAVATALQPRTDSGNGSVKSTRRGSFETVVPASTAESTAIARPLLKDGDDVAHAPMPFTRTQHSQSVSEGIRGARERLAWQQEHGTGVPMPGSVESSWEELPAPRELTESEARTSFRSVGTTNSSLLSSFDSAERSSMATGFSSTSDFVKVGRDSSIMQHDENFSVEDAIGMYAEGFETPSKRSLDVIREAPTDRRSSSPLSPRRPRHSHRRSRSAVDLAASAAKAQSDVTGTGALQAASVDKTDATPLGLVSTADSTTAKQRRAAARNSRSSKASRTSKASKSSQQPVARDRYGFKKISHHVTLQEYDAWERPYNEHLERRRAKWDALMKQFGLATDQPTRFPPKSEKVKRYARKGIPPEWRGAAWFWYAGGPGLLKQNDGLYYSLLLKIKRDDELKETDREHIERDLNRTFPDNLTFKPDSADGDPAAVQDGTGPETHIIGALRRVLQAFAVHRPGIGYCQSLNFIAGLLLLFLDCDEEKAFILLNVITSEYLPGTHGISLEGANIDIAVLMSSLKELLPTVWAKLDDQPSSAGPLALPTVSLATTPWFLTLFLTTLPIEAALRVRDVLFIEGSKTLFRAALAILKLAEPRIREVSDQMEVFQIVQTAPRSLLDANTLMELCFRKRGGFGGLSQDTIERRREEGRRGKRDAKRVGTEGFPALMEPGPADKVAGAISRLRSRTKGARG